MRLAIIAAILVLTACSEEPVGNSPYFDPWENPQFQPQQPAVAAKSTEVSALEQQLAAKRLENQARQARLNGDSALVASLEAAIATAGNNALAQPPVITQVPNPQVVQSPQIAPQVANVPQPQTTTTINGNNQISNNSFSNVVQNQTIETDRARLAALEQQKVELEAAPLPSRDTGVNLALFARSTTHAIGKRVYSRSFRGSASRACRSYGNPDAAQRAFLAAGGPDRDSLKLDPDGDGFVCGWSPMQFRNLKVNG